jgi:hypothetical protein
VTSLFQSFYRQAEAVQSTVPRFTAL